MKRTALYSIAIVLFATALSQTSKGAPPFLPTKSAGANQGEAVQWQTNLHSAHKIATTENKPMLVVFGADWCHFCKKLEKETLTSPEISKYVNDSFVAVHLDADTDKKAAEILNVTGLPCTIVLSPKADLLGRIDGYYTPGPFYQKLAEAKQKHQVVQRTSITK
ncbi:thiol:disulfide interchange protein precursor [Thalassoglobus neptunius]|uniref:Thiol:disulfide interchange protein n=1 Tax=Thalassoglobus neptunius TaxID=1938619 RepID=A0A5C5X4H0_9PLAN|nr:thioredoxin family protein [Thalassoglobus neptunius]TWT57032.1 thiol:disulfide interchange protein precursor [Thalassoglobus neptunius]